MSEPEKDNTPKTEESKKEEIKVEEAKIEELKTEIPKIEEPKTEKPKPEEIKKEIPIIEEPEEEPEEPEEEKIIELSPNLFEEINSLKEKNIYLINKSFESKIPEILSYLIDSPEKSPIQNKITILKYFQDLFKKVEFYPEIFLKNKSIREHLNIYEIIIHEFITNIKSENSDKIIDDYYTELKNIFILLLSKISFDKKTYKYIFSFLINYLNKNNINNNAKDINLNSENISKILELLNIFYTTIPSIKEKSDSIYFNDIKSDYLIKIENKDNINLKKILNLDDSLFSWNVLIFMKLVSNDVIKNLENDFNMTLFELDFGEKNKNKNILFNIDKEYNLINFSTQEKITKLDDKKYINILFKFLIKDNFKIELYLNSKKLEFKNDTLNIKIDEKTKAKEKFEIKSINLFKNFIGQCSNIIIYKNRKHDEGIPKFLLTTQNIEIKPKPKANTISALFDMSATKQEKIIKQEIVVNDVFKKGLYCEELLNLLAKQELKDEVDQNIDILFKNIQIKDKDKIPANDIKDFLDKIVAIYTPSRMEYNTNNGNIILKDSINSLDAIFYTNKSSNLNGVHIYDNLMNDFNIVGGLNHFIPILELMLTSENLLKTENIVSFLNLILSILKSDYYKLMLKNEKNYLFFSNLAFFLEKIPSSNFNTELADIIINISTVLIEKIFLENKELNKDFQSYILFNEKLFYKFKYPEQKKILDQIRSILNLYYIQKEEFLNFDIMKIINILLYYDKEKYTKFCCKIHSEYFEINDKKNEIMSPELCEIIQPLEYILKLFFKKYSEEPSFSQKDNKTGNYELSVLGKDILSLFEVLTLAVSPCLQKSIIKLFFEFFEENLENAYKYVNLLDKEGRIFDVCLFVLKSTVFEYKSDILNFINLLVKIKKKLNLKNSAKNKEKEILPSVNISGNNKVFMNNNILPFYLISKEELKDVDDSKIIKNFYGVGGIEYNYITKTDTEKTIFDNYNKKKLPIVFLDLYNNIFKSFKENPEITLNLDFLVKINSKGYLSLISTFLRDLMKEKNNIEEINKNNILLNFLLETYLQVFMIKSTNFDKSKFISRFYYACDNESEFKTKIDDINKLCKIIINDILMANVYKLDYLLTWSKYYFEISKNKSKITKELFEEFIYDIISELDKNKFKSEIVVYDNYRKKIEGLYFINFLFELVSYFRLTIIKEEENGRLNIISDKNIYDELFSSFDYILLNRNISAKLNSPNKTKWKHYPFFKKIFTYFSPLWNKSMKDEIEIGKYIENKKNINTYLSELEILFYDIDEGTSINAEFTKQNIINRGTKLIYLLYHYFMQLFNLGGEKDEINEVLTAFRNFLTVIVISSCTLSTKIDQKRERKWPKNDDYKNVQIVVKNIVYQSLLFFHKSISKFENILNSNKTLSPEDKNYHLFIKNILYSNFAYLLRLMNIIYRQTRKEEDQKTKKTGVKGLFSKMKNLLADSEGVKTSGIYSLYEKMYTILNLDTDYNIKNYIDNIPQIDFNISEKPINNKIIECINNFMSDATNKRFFELSETINNDEDINKNKLYPFVDYIKKRNLSLNNFIPLYDVLPNVEFDPNNDEKNNILKRLYLVSDYFQKCPYDKTLEKNIKVINTNLNKKILLNIKKTDIEDKTKIYAYIKEKKKLFSFLGLWSFEDYFYNKKKYEIKYKLVNHLTSDYTRILFEPIMNLDYYLPEFTRYNYDELFRKTKNKNIVTNCADLSFIVKEHKNPLIDEKEEDEINNEENKEKEKDKEKINEIKTEEKKDNYNSLFDIKLNYYNDLENITLNSDISSIPIDQDLFKEYILQKYSPNLTLYDAQSEACLINPSVHITGIIFNNQEGIGFYSNEKKFEKNNEDYDIERLACFGSVFRPQNTKYNYYYVFIPYNSIEFVLKRRYFHRRNTFEIFTVNKKSYLFKLDDAKFRAVYDNIKHYMKSTIEDINIEYSNIDNKIGFYNKQIFLKLNNSDIPLTKNKDMNLKAIYENWSKWKISSLKFLMLLNLYASRTYQDLNQYPVFPWIITEYQKKNINLSEQNNNIIRLFNTPMGMMDITPDAEDRKRSYLETFNSGKDDDDEEEEENYDRYRSHYSTSLYATYYLVRIFPYSYIRIELQGKSFDDPNRLFNSVKNSFNNALTQKSDVRELIPEFFCLPEMFYNYNKLNLGVLSNQEREVLCNHVDTPEWASHDGYLFIAKHREMLESPEISEKINEWINIIFGFKQKGKEAKKINNLFMKESYEDYDDVYKKSNEETKVYLCKVIEFGVTPSQLFKNEANKRMAYTEFKNYKYLLPNMSEYLKNSENIFNENDIDFIVDETNLHINGIPYKLGYTESIKGKYRLSVITFDKIKTYKRVLEKIQVKKGVPLASNTNAENNTTLNASGNNPTDNSIEEDKGKEKEKEIIKLYVELKKDIKITSNKNRINNNCTLFYNSGKNIAFGGYWNGIIILQYLEENADDKKSKNKNSNIIYAGESSPIVKIAIDKNDTFAVCGNKLGQIFVYIINQNNKMEWVLYKKIYNQRTEITSLAINEELNMFISCSKDGLWFNYTLPNCALVNSFKFSNSIFKEKDKKIYYPKISLISNSPLPCAIFYFEERQSLCVFSINGKLIQENKIGYKIGENHIKKYADNQFNEYLLLFNEDKNCIEVFNIVELKSVISLPLIEHNFVDFLPGKDLDHISVLVKYKSKNDEKNIGPISMKTSYKILVIRNNNLEIDWR